MSSIPSPLPQGLAQSAPKTRKSRALLPIYWATALIYSFLLPQQFNVDLAGIVVSPYRVLLISASLWLVARAVRGQFQPNVIDWLMICAVLWIFLATYMVSDSATKSLEIGGSHAVDILLAYFLGRVTIRTAHDLRLWLILIAPAVAFMGMMVFAESLSHRYIVQPIASALTGAPYPQRFEVRLGLGRGMASLHHPILAGIFLSSFLPIYLLSGIRGWPRIFGILGSVCAFFTMSSAALLGLLAGGAFAAYNWITEKFTRLSWRLLLVALAVLYAIVESLSNRSFYQLLIDYASLRQASAYNRVLIWNFGTENVARHPWFGIGYADWDRPSWMHSGSFDHFWLLMSLRFGIPETVFIGLATLIALVALALRSRRCSRVDQRSLRGVAISLAVFAIGISSVALWQSTLAWYFMLLGVAVSLGQSPLAAARPTRPAASSKGPTRY